MTHGTAKFCNNGGMHEYTRRHQRVMGAQARQQHGRRANGNTTQAQATTNAEQLGSTNNTVSTTTTR